MSLSLGVYSEKVGGAVLVVFFRYCTCPHNSYCFRGRLEVEPHGCERFLDNRGRCLSQHWTGAKVLSLSSDMEIGYCTFNQYFLAVLNQLALKGLSAMVCSTLVNVQVNSIN